MACMDFFETRHRVQMGANARCKTFKAIEGNGMALQGAQGCAVNVLNSISLQWKASIVTKE